MSHNRMQRDQHQQAWTRPYQRPEQTRQYLNQLIWGWPDQILWGHDRPGQNQQLGRNQASRTRLTYRHNRQFMWEFPTPSQFGQYRPPIAGRSSTTHCRSRSQSFLLRQIPARSLRIPVRVLAGIDTTGHLLTGRGTERTAGYSLFAIRINRCDQMRITRPPSPSIHSSSPVRISSHAWEQSTTQGRPSSRAMAAP